MFNFDPKGNLYNLKLLYLTSLRHGVKLCLSVRRSILSREKQVSAEVPNTPVLTAVKSTDSCLPEAGGVRLAPTTFFIISRLSSEQMSTHKSILMASGAI